MTFTDAPIPSNPDAQFSAWRQGVEERIARVERKPITAHYVLDITQTTDANGRITFSHNALTTPVAAFIQPISPSGGVNAWSGTAVESITSTSVTFRAFAAFGTTASISLHFYAFIYLNEYTPIDV